MRVITQNCVLFLWMYTLTCVKSQECTLEQFLNSRLYDSNFDVTDLDSSYPSGGQVRVSCNVGFSGFFKLTCVQGRWDSKGTKCQPRSCGHPGDAQFAEFHLAEGDDFVFGSKVEYTCHKGYQMITRTNYRNCMANGWDGVVPICEPQNCLALDVDRNVQVNGDLEEATYGNVVRFSCKFNKEILDGPTEIYCDENGEWSGPAPKCKEITCAPPVIDNGQVLEDIQEYKEHQVLNFVCNVNYKPTDERSPKCMKIGTRAEWSPTPLCERITCKLKPPVEGTRYDPAYKNVFAPGDTMTVICGEKYWISNPQETSAVVRCNEDGEWSIKLPCIEVTCRRLYPRDQHLHSFTLDDYWKQKITMDDTARYQCRTGYKITGRTNQAVCTRGGWTPNPLCQAITCEPVDIRNAELVDPKWRYRYREQAKYVCNDGYRGNPTLTCERDGWTGHSQCEEIKCEQMYIPNAQLVDPKWTYGYNEQAKYVCRDGYTGNLTLTCERNGWTWSSQCTEITCEPEDIPNAELVTSTWSMRRSTYRNGEQVSYNCKDGYTGNPTRTCGRDGWTGSSQCEEITCVPGDIQNAELVNRKGAYTYNEQATYVCKEGYRGNVTRICKRIRWTGNSQCTAITCVPEDIPNAELVTSKQRYKYREQAKYECKDGYMGNPTRTCERDGWTGSSQCAACSKIEVPHGFAVVYNDSLYYTCSEGYKLISKGWWGEAKCNGGKWSRLDECIETQNCGKIPLIPNGNMAPQPNVYREGDKIDIICEEGYERQTDSLFCLKGQWSSNGIPLETICKLTSKQCSPPPRVENAVVETSYKKKYLSGTEVIYRCRDGYSMEGENTLQCSDEGWEQKSIKCIPPSQEQ